MILKFKGKPGSITEYTLIDNIDNVTLQRVKHLVGTAYDADVDDMIFVYGDETAQCSEREINQLICEKTIISSQQEKYFHIVFDCTCYICNDNGKTIETIYECAENPVGVFFR